MMKEIWKLIQSDYQRYTNARGGITMVMNALFAWNHCFTYSFWLRLANTNIFLIRLTAKIMHRRLSRKYGIQISPKMKLGYGFYIGHGVSFVINSGTRSGNNWNSSQNLTIGTNGE